MKKNVFYIVCIKMAICFMLLASCDKESRSLNVSGGIGEKSVSLEDYAQKYINALQNEGGSIPLWLCETDVNFVSSVEKIKIENPKSDWDSKIEELRLGYERNLRSRVGIAVISETWSKICSSDFLFEPNSVKCDLVEIREDKDGMGGSVFVDCRYGPEMQAPIIESNGRKMRLGSVKLKVEFKRASPKTFVETKASVVADSIKVFNDPDLDSVLAEELLKRFIKLGGNAPRVMLSKKILFYSKEDLKKVEFVNNKKVLESRGFSVGIDGEYVVISPPEKWQKNLFVKSSDAPNRTWDYYNVSNNLIVSNVRVGKRSGTNRWLVNCSYYWQDDMEVESLCKSLEWWRHGGGITGMVKPDDSGFGARVWVGPECAYGQNAEFWWSPGEGWLTEHAASIRVVMTESEFVKSMKQTK